MVYYVPGSVLRDFPALCHLCFGDLYYSLFVEGENKEYSCLVPVQAYVPWSHLGCDWGQDLISALTPEPSLSTTALCCVDSHLVIQRAGVICLWNRPWARS